MNVLVDEEPIGTLWMGRPFSGDADTWYIFDIEIAKELRGRGFGRAAMEAAEAWTRERGGTRVALNVFGPNLDRAFALRLTRLRGTRHLHVQGHLKRTDAQYVTAACAGSTTATDEFALADGRHHGVDPVVIEHAVDEGLELLTVARRVVGDEDPAGDDFRHDHVVARLVHVLLGVKEAESHVREFVGVLEEVTLDELHDVGDAGAREGLSGQTQPWREGSRTS